MRCTEHAMRRAPGLFSFVSGGLRKPSAFNAIRQTGLARNAAGSHGVKRRSSAMRSASLQTGVKMSTYARCAPGMFLQTSMSSGLRISRLSSQGGIGP